MTESITISKARKILGVNASDTKETIKKNYRALAFKHHPDRNGDPEEFKRVSEAYRVLSKRQKINTEWTNSNEVNSILDCIFNEWLGEQDNDIQNTITRKLHRLENEEI